MFGPGLPVERLCNPIPTLGPRADFYQQQQQYLLQNPDQLFLAPDCQAEVYKTSFILLFYFTFTNLIIK